MTKKKLIGIIAAVVVLACMVVALVLLQNMETPEEEVEVADVIYVIGGQAATPSKRIAVTNEAGGYVLVTENPEEERAADIVYVLEGYEDYDANRNSLVSIANTAKSLTARSVVAESPSDLSIYGLANPRATVEITYSDNSSARLLVGDSAPGSEGIYVQNGEGDTVYLAATTNVEKYLDSPLDLMDLTIVSTENDGYTFTRMVLGGTVREEPIVMEEAGEAASAMFSTHVMVTPISAGVNPDMLEQLASVFAITADAVVALVEDEDEWAVYGLDEPYSTIDVLTEEESIALELSAPTDGSVYLRKKGGNVVYRVSVDKVAWLDVDAYSLISKMIVLPQIDTVATVIVETPNDKLEFTLEGEGDELVVTLEDGTGVEVKSFRKFYQNLIGASYEGETDEELPEDAQPILSYTYIYRDSSQREELRFYQSGQARRMLVTYNGGKPYYVMSTYVDKVIDDLPRIREGEEISTYL